MRISLGANAARRDVDETITGLWTFANALGLLTDDIGERTGAEGVTVDGLLIKDAGIPEAAVTAHEAALAILESQIVDGTILARIAASESITGLWAFLHASGLRTDVITEVNAGVGVTVDGLLIKDAGIPEAAVTAHEAALAILESQITDGTIFGRLAAVETVAALWTFAAGITAGDRLAFVDIALAANNILVSTVVSESDPQFGILASGLMSWGSGSAARDTNLYRVAADTLRTDDSFVVNKTLFVTENITSESKDTTLTADVNSFDSGSVPVQRIDNDALWTIRGIDGTVTGRHIWMLNIDGTNDIFLTHEDAAATAAERMILPNAASYRIDFGSAAHLWYDNTSSRWRLLGERTT